jgi:hypothetical protein
MPEPILYIQAMCAAASVSVLLILTFGWLLRAQNSAQINLVSILGIGLGLVAGYSVLQLQLVWPPTNALGRLLLIVLPVAMAIEIVAGFRRIPRWCVWLLRLVLSEAAGRILLHGSTYLGGPHCEWTTAQAFMVLALCGTILSVEWGLLSWLSRRSPGSIAPLAVALTIQCAGATIMLAGYVSGGAAALPLVAAIVGSACVAGWLVRRPDSQAAVGVGVVGLFGLLFIGRFFGALSTTAALTLMVAPLLCWVAEIPILGRQRRWLVGTISLVLVATPLLIVLILAKQYFDEYTLPLL